MNIHKTSGCRTNRTPKPLWVLLVLLLPLPVLGMTGTHGTQVSTVTVEIGHRIHPDFHQQIQTKMNVKEQVGDTDFFFEIIEFYPHFAYIDSTKEIVSLSDEPTNAAFKIRVYENDEVVEDTWAFFALKVPHFSPTSYLTFDVTSFVYREETYEDNGEEKDEADSI
ncbi:MAG: hypothetical protein JSW50_15950 [Candidatus Latescibacterota bacterium]|nr:MAG: hypothetical protein JSW50_15950 [Candidatus Latescibacterota bacterium]